MKDTPPSSSTLTLACLIDALLFDHWQQVDRMFKAIVEASRPGRGISKLSTIAQRLGMNESTFSKFRTRVEKRLESIFQEEVLLLENDRLPTEMGERVARIAAWVVSTANNTYFIDP
jgi:hypothetical protein